MICEIEGCIREARSAKMCRAHYTQMYVHGRIKKAEIGPLIKRERPYRLKPKEIRICKSNCNRKVLARDMCAMHYFRDYKGPKV